MAHAAAEALERARKSNATIREERDEAAKLAAKNKRDAREAGEELDRASGKLKRLSDAVMESTSPERAVAVGLASLVLGLGGTKVTGWITNKVGNAVPFVKRNAAWFRAGIPAATGTAGWIVELATRPKGPLTTGRHVASAVSGTAAILGFDGLIDAFAAKARENARILAAAQQQGT